MPVRPRQKDQPMPLFIETGIVTGEYYGKRGRPSTRIGKRDRQKLDKDSPWSNDLEGERPVSS